jgi:hypothetical protein
MITVMDYEQIKNRLAPCGLDCGKCYAFSEGDIKNFSRSLKESLGDFDIYAERFSDLTGGDIFKRYPDFKELLAYFSEGDCRGCRNENCKIFKDCNVRGCFETKGVDFCFQCPDFPCDNTGFDQHLQKRFVKINERMKQVGVENYFVEIKDKPRY